MRGLRMRQAADADPQNSLDPWPDSGSSAHDKLLIQILFFVLFLLSKHFVAYST